MLNYISLHWFEIIAATLGIIAIYFQIKVKPFYWIISLVVSSMYIVVYFSAKLYADMSMQFYYVGMSIYGLYVWLSGNNNSDKKTIPISKIKNFKSWIIIVLISALSFIIIGYILKNFTDSNVPWWDSFTTSLSFVATWMLARKKIENWLVWIVVDATSVALYIYKQLYPTTILFIVLTLLAIVGYFQWKRELRTLENN
ncbi:MAG TPA: nicotinamide riboside transporter PnuC [Bacteroidales bacterium]|nr:nicotinamide mononucleotide transporter [Bacteroidales bacterium]MBP8946353.1 nicotinamide mononucleotide transporter [Bacteroidales bacterium]HNY76092.1 nicotinamide riboside transporter PnuC [Bacteroidales bacterium]HOC40004.1 nicotinamide riboside transporter PnuC [Bacteroidales bacterium]HOF06878.1 nicotinamide riboside transporter PnuC [Bacteroidales bacterium]